MAITSMVYEIISFFDKIFPVIIFLGTSEYSIFVFFSFVTILLVLTLGIIKRKKSKNQTNSNIAIISVVCGVIGFWGLMFSVMIFLVTNEYSIFAFFSLAIILFALILGIIERKKSKNQTNINMATVGIVLGLIGIIVQIFPIIYIIYTTSSILAYNNYNKSIKFQTIYPVYSGSYCFFCDSYGCKSLAIRGQYDSFSITTKTKDTDQNYAVTVVMYISYEIGDIITEYDLDWENWEKIIENELREFIKKYFSEKYASELKPEYEKKMRRELKNIYIHHFIEQK
jgi:uncharacterized membrane protein